MTAEGLIGPSSKGESMRHEKRHTMAHEGHSCGCRGHAGGKHGSNPAALDILDERFARGEIDKAEYQEMKQLISQRTAAKPDVTQPHPSAATASPKTQPAKR